MLAPCWSIPSSKYHLSLIFAKITEPIVDRWHKIDGRTSARIIGKKKGNCGKIEENEKGLRNLREVDVSRVK